MSHPTDTLSHYFERRGFSPVTAETPYADLLHRSAAFGEGEGGMGPLRPLWDVDAEAMRETWAPRGVVPGGLCPPPTRYVDGAARASLLAWGQREDGSFSAVVGGVIGAMAARIEDRRIVPESEQVPGQHAELAVALAEPGGSEEEIAPLVAAGEAAGIRLFATTRVERLPEEGEFGGIERARTSAHTLITNAMSSLELIAISGSADAASPPDVLTVVDGNLSSHLTDEARWTWPLAGVVKRHQMTEIPNTVARTILALRIGQRTPFVLIHAPPSNNRPTLVSWYLKIRGDYGSALAGVIRIEVPLPYARMAAAGDLSAWADCLSSHLYEARAVRSSYSREDCSLQPILLIEDRLHAKSGDMTTIRSRIQRVLPFLKRRIS